MRLVQASPHKSDVKPSPTKGDIAPPSPFPRVRGVDRRLSGESGKGDLFVNREVGDDRNMIRGVRPVACLVEDA